MKLTIKDITGNPIDVTDIAQAIIQCKRCADSPYRMESGATVGENHRFMLEQLYALQRNQSHKKLHR